MIKKTLSIVIPCYKINENKAYINALLKAIYSQRLNSIEIDKILLINDSPEFSLTEYIDVDNLATNLHILDNLKNSGQAFSRNFGLSFVTSEYVHFIDQDDLIDENFYYNLDFSSDVLIAKCLLFKNDLALIHTKFSKEFLLNKFKTLNQLKFFLIFDNIVLSPGQVVFKTKVIQSVGGFPVLLNYGSDDFGLMFNLSQLYLSYSYNDDSLFFHRLHDLQGKNVLNMNASRFEFLCSIDNNIFVYLCKVNWFPINVIKKLLYFIFYNRF